MDNGKNASSKERDTQWPLPKISKLTLGIAGACSVLATIAVNWMTGSPIHLSVRSAVLLATELSILFFMCVAIVHGLTKFSARNWPVIIVIVAMAVVLSPFFKWAADNPNHAVIKNLRFFSEYRLYFIGVPVVTVLLIRELAKDRSSRKAFGTILKFLTKTAAALAVTGFLWFISPLVVQIAGGIILAVVALRKIFGIELNIRKMPVGRPEREHQ